MASFGEAFCLTLITNDPALAARADNARINRIGVDLEVLGKAERQIGQDTRLSKHSFEDLAAVAAAVSRANVFARLNSLNPESQTEVDRAIEFGADVLMLPFFSTVLEADAFVRLVAGRADVVLLVETPAAVVRIREIVAVAGIKEVMVGLNDLRLAFGLASHFEVLASPLLECIAAEVRRANLQFSVGGITRPTDLALPVSPDLVLAQYPRLNATGAWISRSFLRPVIQDSLEQESTLEEGIASIRRRLDVWASASSEMLGQARRQLAERSMLLGQSPPAGMPD